MSSDNQRYGRQVAVFGAGIAGLTAAHELVERGFDVEVYEVAAPSLLDQFDGAACSVGGVARTQWGRVEIDEHAPGQPGPNNGPPLPFDHSPVQPLLLHLDPPDGRNRAYFQPGTASFVDNNAVDVILDRIVAAIHGYVVGHGPIRQIEVRGFTHARPVEAGTVTPPSGAAATLDYERAHVVAQQLQAKLAAQTGIPKPIDVQVSARGYGLANDPTQPDDRRDFASVHMVEDWIPGEHGFRFFPSCYHNLFDTLRRIPVPDDGHAVYQDTPRTVLDNLLPPELFGILGKNASGAQQLTIRREPPRSLQVLFEELSSVMKALGITVADQARFQLKLFQYMTSCRQRREQSYENLSWAEFLELDDPGYSAEFRTYTNSSAQLLVAMDATRCDARTYGNISVQILQDQLQAGRRVDGTLTGPTSLVWFEHWRRYLEMQGVRFLRGRLDGFVHADAQTIWPKVTIWRDFDADGAKHAAPVATPTVLVRDFYVVAIPGQEVQKLLIQDDPTSQLQGPDLDRIRHFPFGDATQVDTGGALAHMSGIQYFFDCDFKILAGHAIYPDSPWRLSSISQPQFWTQRTGWWTGYRSIVSVDIGSWNISPQDGSPIAWESSRQQIAQETWQQIKAAVDLQIGASIDLHRQRGMPLPRTVCPEPIFYHLDDNLQFGTAGVTANHAPLLINRAGEFRERPGRLDRLQGYELNYGNLVFAGVHMQTYTRLTTMEAANESARHAVNAILNACADPAPGSSLRPYRGDFCSISDPEDNEPADLQILLTLDERLHAMELPHFVEILGLKSLPTQLLQPDPDLSILGGLVA